MNDSSERNRETIDFSQNECESEGISKNLSKRKVSHKEDKGSNDFLALMEDLDERPAKAKFDEDIEEVQFYTKGITDCKQLIDTNKTAILKWAMLQATTGDGKLSEELAKLLVKKALETTTEAQTRKEVKLEDLPVNILEDIANGKVTIEEVEAQGYEILDSNVIEAEELEYTEVVEEVEQENIDVDTSELDELC